MRSDLRPGSFGKTFNIRELGRPGTAGRFASMRMQAAIFHTHHERLRFLGKSGPAQVFYSGIRRDRAVVSNQDFHCLSALPMVYCTWAAECLRTDRVNPAVTPLWDRPSSHVARGSSWLRPRLP